MTAATNQSTLAKPATEGTRRERRAWYLYDFGNSAYAAVVLLAVYPTYFKEQVVGGAQGSFYWGLAVGIAMLVVALSSPLLGAIADYAGTKKRFLLTYTAITCVFCALLFFVQEDMLVFGMVTFIIAEIGYRSAQVFYNALLPEIASQEEIGRVSGTGWAIGSAGGIVCLLIILPLIMLIKGTTMVRLSMPITALFFALAAVPIFLRVKERAKRKALPKGDTYFSLGFRQLWQTLKALRGHRQFAKFVLAFLIYNDGILMALNFSSILGAVLYGMEQQQLIIFMIIVQVTSVAGAYLFGLISEKVGCKPSLIAALLLMLIAVMWLFWNQTTLGFFGVGALAGFALTGVQSVSRAMVGSFSPPGQSASFYGMFAVAGRTSSFIGPTVFGWLAAGVTRRYMAQGQTALLAEQHGHRMAVLSIAAFLIVGLVLLLTVNERRGRADAIQQSQES